MTIIDGKGKLNHSKITKFILSENVELTAKIPDVNFEEVLTGETTNDKLFSFFTNKEVAEEIKEFKNDLLIQIYNTTDDTLLELNKIDYTYWSKPERINKLFGLDVPIVEKAEKTEKKEKPAKQVLLIPVACGIKEDDGSVAEINKFTGTNKEVVSFLNSVGGELQVKFFQKKTVIYNIGYQNDEELNDPTNWFTFDELVAAGVFTE